MLSMRLLTLLTLISGLVPLGGCTMCASPDTDAYPTYGGIWQRTDRYHGRVGSIFEPAGVKVARAADQGPVLAPELVPPGEPTPAEEEGSGEEPSDAAADGPMPIPGANEPPADAAPTTDGTGFDEDMESIRQRLREQSSSVEADL